MEKDIIFLRWRTSPFWPAYVSLSGTFKLHKLNQRKVIESDMGVFRGHGHFNPRYVSLAVQNEASRSRRSNFYPKC